LRQKISIAVRHILTIRANPNYYYYHGKTLVVLAIERRDVQVLDLLAADFNLKSVYGPRHVFAAIAAKGTVLLTWLK
jgi:hypothetical protein